MRTQVLNHRNAMILEVISPITSEDDALDLVSACAEADTSNLLLEGPAISDGFLDLRTRVAGEFLQKLQNYHLRTAGVFPAERDYSDRFREFLLEARRGQAFRAFVEHNEALDWLSGD